MKVAGALTLVAAFVAAILFALIPTSVTVFGTTGSCGPPVLRIFIDNSEASTTDDFGFEQSVVDQCVGQSWMRLVVGGAVAGVLGIGGALMFALAPARPRPVLQQGWPAAPGYGWAPQQPYPQNQPPGWAPTIPQGGWQQHHDGHPPAHQPPTGPPTP